MTDEEVARLRARRAARTLLEGAEPRSLVSDWAELGDGTWARWASGASACQGGGEGPVAEAYPPGMGPEALRVEGVWMARVRHGAGWVYGYSVTGEACRAFCDLMASSLAAGVSGE